MRLKDEWAETGARTQEQHDRMLKGLPPYKMTTELAGKDMAYALGSRAQTMWTQTVGDVSPHVFPPIAHGVMMNNGEYRVFRQIGVETVIQSSDLTSMCPLGSEAFFALFIDPMLASMAQLIDEQVVISFGRRDLLARHFKHDLPIAKSPYWWQERHQWKALPLLITVDMNRAALPAPTLTVRYQMILAHSEQNLVAIPGECGTI